MAIGSIEWLVRLDVWFSLRLAVWSSTNEDCVAVKIVCGYELTNYFTGATMVARKNIAFLVMH